MIKERFQNIEKRFYKLKGVKNSLEKIISDYEKQIAEVKLKEVDIEKCLKVLQTLIEMKKEKIKNRIENLVTKGLRTIFEREDYRFEIEMELKRGSMSARPILYSRFGNKEFSTDIIDGHGGGVVDVTAFILQVIVLLALSNKLEKVIIADEAFKHVSQEYLSNVAQFMQYLNEITGIQIIMVTHKSEFLDVADKKYEVRLNDKQETIIKELLN